MNKRHQVAGAVTERSRFGVTQLCGEAWQPKWAVYYGDEKGTVVAHFFDESVAKEYSDWRNAPGDPQPQKTKEYEH